MEGEEMGQQEFYEQYEEEQMAAAQQYQQWEASELLNLVKTYCPSFSISAIVQIFALFK